MDKLCIEYEVGKAGWAEAKISNGEDQVLVTVSYLNDSLLELAEMALALKNGATEVKVLFMDEPGEHQFLVSVQGSDATYEIRWYNDWESWGFRKEPDFHLVLKGKTSVQRIVQQVTQALWRIHENIGPEKYKELWIEHEFPMKQFKELSNA